MPARLYIGVEGVLVYQYDRTKRARRRFEITRYGLTFLEWAIYGFHCFWLTTLNQNGGDHRIRRALALALGHSKLPSEFDLLFEIVRPTYWESNMAEAIHVDSSFYWIANNPDETAVRGLKKQGLPDRLILTPPLDSSNDLSNLQVRLEGAYW